MTPEQAISAAFRGASRELSRAAVRLDAYPEFLASTRGHLDLAEQMLSTIAAKREKSSSQTMTQLECAGLHEIMAATIGAILTLAHYPYLRRIDWKEDLT